MIELHYHAIAYIACRLATKEQEIKWYNISKRLTFSAACRAAIGDVLNKKELDDLFPIASTVGKGVFSVVCICFSYLVFAHVLLRESVRCMHDAQHVAKKPPFIPFVKIEFSVHAETFWSLASANKICRRLLEFRCYPGQCGPMSPVITMALQFLASHPRKLYLTVQNFSMYK